MPYLGNYRKNNASSSCYFAVNRLSMATIDFNKSEILRHVKMNVSMVSRSEVDADGNSRYPDIALAAQDRQMLDDVFEVAVSHLVRGVHHVLAGIVRNEDGDSALTIEVSRVNEALVPELAILAKDYLRNYVTGYWLLLNGVSRNEMFLSDASESLQGIRNIVFTKTAPSLKHYGDAEQIPVPVITE